MEKLWNLFTEQINLMSENDGPCQICKEVNTDEERLLYVMTLCKDINFKPALCEGPKTTTQSKKLREEGNKLYAATPFTSETCLETLKLYCKSLANAPIGSKEQAMAYANRSAVLCRMRKYNECLKDIQRAFTLDYPDVLRCKLYLRKIECLIALDSFELDDAIDEADLWADRMNMNDSNYAQYIGKMRQLMKQVPSKQNIDEKDQLHSHKPSLPVIKNTNPEAPCASDAIAIKYNKEYGRHLVATRNIEIGEALMLEKPYVMLLAPSNVETHCHYCLEVCWAMIPCHSCNYAMYCSEKCKDTDWESSHDIECPIFPTLANSNSNPQARAKEEPYFQQLVLMALRLTILAIRRSGGIDKLKEIVKEVDKGKDMRTKGFSKDGIFHSDQYRSIYSLVTNTEERSGIDLLWRAFNAVIIMHFVLLCPYQTLVPENDRDAFVFTGALMLRHLQMIPCNMCSWDAMASPGRRYKRGTVLMPLFSLLNNTCDRQVARLSAFGHTIAYSLRPITKGEQILVNYGSIYQELPKAERQKYLLQNYYFVCRCVPCREDWPVTRAIASYNKLVPNSTKQRAVSDAVDKITECMVYVSKDQHIYYSEVTMKQMVVYLYDNVPRPCVQFCYAIEMLNLFYRLQGNRIDLPTIRKEAIHSNEEDDYMVFS